MNIFGLIIIIDFNFSLEHYQATFLDMQEIEKWAELSIAVMWSREDSQSKIVFALSF